MNNRNGIIAGIIIVVIIIAGALIYKTQSEKNNSDKIGANQNSLDAIDGTTMNQPANPTPTPTPEASATAVAKLSYGEAVNKYKNKIQFLSCNGTPGTVAAAKGSVVLLDNRDKTNHLIKIGGQSVTVKASDFEPFVPNTKGDFNVTCDGGGAAILKVD
jgi:hypothetical protein